MTADGGLPPVSASVVRPVDLGRPERELSSGPGAGALSRTEAARDERVRRWDVATPAATRIGRPRSGEDDVPEGLRRLHDEQHPAMSGHGERMHRLDKVRITHAIANELGLTPWERDRAIGIMSELDLTAFGSQRGVPKVALVAVRHVVDEERRRRLGLHDDEWVRAQPPERLEELYERFESIKDDPRYRELMEEHGLESASVNRLGRTLRERLSEQGIEEVAFGRSPYRDPALSGAADGSGRRGGDAARGSD